MAMHVYIGRTHLRRHGFLKLQRLMLDPSVHVLLILVIERGRASKHLEQQQSYCPPVHLLTVRFLPQYLPQRGK